MRRILILLIILFCALGVQAQPPLSTISGVIYRPNGAVCQLCSFDIIKSRKGGVVLNTTPVKVPANINGEVSFTAVQGSIITISGNFWLGSYSFAGGKELFIPNSPTASFASLKSPEDTLDTLIGGGGSFENPLTFTAPLSRSINTISLAPSGVTAGSCTNCNLTIDTFGRITAKANGSGGGGGSLTAPFLFEDNRSSTTPNDYAFTLEMDYDGDATPATQLVQLGLASRMIYGATNASSQGTVHTFTSTIDVQGSDNASSEFSGWMGWMKFRAGQVGRAWYTDYSLHGAVGTQQQQLNGVSMLLNNYFNGDPSQGPSTGYIAITSQGKGAGNEDTHNTQVTYPTGIGFAAVGHSGDPAGPGEGTARGWRVGFQAGGQAGGWMGTGERSWLGYGLSVVDHDAAGVLLGRPRGANVAGVQFAAFTSDGTDSYQFPIDMANLDATDLFDSSARAIRLPGVNSIKGGIQWGTDGTAPVLYRSANNTLQTSAGKLILDGTGLTSPILSITAPTGINAPLFEAGSLGGTDANSFRFYNGNGDVTTFVSGGTGQFIPDTLIGDGGIRVPTGKRLFFGDTTRARLMLKESVASPTSFLVIGNAASGENPTLSPLAASGNVGITSTMINSGAFIIEGSNGLNDVGVLSVRRAGTTRGFNFIPSAGLSSDPHLRLASGQSWSTALFNEADGAIASLAINASQSGARTNATVGGIFRLDTRTGVGGLANGEQSFVIYGVPTGGDSPAARFVSSLQDGNTLINPNGGTTAVGATTAASEQFGITSLSASRVSEAVRSAANSTVDLINWFNSVDDTNTVANLATFDSRSNGTPANGFGHSITHLLETTTTNARPAATESVFWMNATEGAQISNLTFSTVNAAVLGERLRISHEGIKPGGVTFANLGTPLNGFIQYCSDCRPMTVGTNNQCTTGGNGALAIYLNATWRCFGDATQ
jgi:hypothetical protein